MKKLIFSVALLSAALSASAEEHPLWMRYPAISPDGTTIAFAYKGDLYSVSVNGGEARQLTTHAAFDSHPVWSPDSKKIAFQSNREGSLDIFVIDAKGGAPTRLTTNSGSETPIAFADNDHVLYSASLQPTAQSIIFGDNTFPQVYKVSTKGGRPELFSTLTMENISIAKNGDILYHDKKGYEDPWRKHQKSPIARDRECDCCPPNDTVVTHLHILLPSHVALDVVESVQFGTLMEAIEEFTVGSKYRDS